MNVKAASWANPASRPEPTPVLPAKCCGQSRARLRRVTAAMPITTRNTTASQSRRLTDLDTGMEVPIFTTVHTEDRGNSSVPSCAEDIVWHDLKLSTGVGAIYCGDSQKDGAFWNQISISTSPFSTFRE